MRRYTPNKFGSSEWPGWWLVSLSPQREGIVPTPRGACLVHRRAARGHRTARSRHCEGRYRPGPDGRSAHRPVNDLVELMAEVRTVVAKLESLFGKAASVLGFVTLILEMVGLKGPSFRSAPGSRQHETT